MLVSLVPFCLLEVRNSVLLKLQNTVFPRCMSVRECSMDSPWYPSENAQMDTSGPIPSPSSCHDSCFQIYAFELPFGWSWHWFFCRYSHDNPTGNLDHTRKASMWVSCSTYCCAFCAASSLWGVHQRMLDWLSLVFIRECSMDSFWYPSEKDAPWYPCLNGRPLVSTPRPVLQIYAFWFSCWYALLCGQSPDPCNCQPCPLFAKRYFKPPKKKGGSGWRLVYFPSPSPRYSEHLK